MPDRVFDRSKLIGRLSHSTQIFWAGGPSANHTRTRGLMTAAGIVTWQLDTYAPPLLAGTLHLLEHGVLDTPWTGGSNRL